MRRSSLVVARLVASIALVSALLAFILGSAPFTPALLLAIAALPVAAACLFFGVWRLSAIAIYWALASLIAVPISRVTPLRLDTLLFALGILGLVLTVLLYFGYRRSILID